MLMQGGGAPRFTPLTVVTAANVGSKALRIDANQTVHLRHATAFVEDDPPPPPPIEVTSLFLTPVVTPQSEVRVVIYCVSGVSHHGRVSSTHW